MDVLAVLQRCLGAWCADVSRCDEYGAVALWLVPHGVRLLAAHSRQVQDGHLLFYRMSLVLSN